jgi:hypothetical protein
MARLTRWQPHLRSWPRKKVIRARRRGSSSFWSRKLPLLWNPAAERGPPDFGSKNDRAGKHPDLVPLQVLYGLVVEQLYHGWYVLEVAVIVIEEFGGSTSAR